MCIHGEANMVPDEARAHEEPAAALLPADRRGVPRHAYELQPFCCFASDGEAGSPPARVRDISTTGIGLLLEQPLKPGAVLILRLQVSDGRLSRPLPARVMHSTPQPDGGWLVGCQFVRPLGSQQLRALLEEE
jgi:hypothetical protein